MGGASQVSNGDYSTTIDHQPSNLNLPNNFGASATKEQSSMIFPGSSIGGDGGSGGARLSEENQVRIKSMLPKTAANFHKMKKGLFLNPLKGYPYNVKEEALARSFNILQAYGEIVPYLVKASKRPKVKARNKSVKVSRGEIY